MTGRRSAAAADRGRTIRLLSILWRTRRRFEQDLRCSVAEIPSASNKIRYGFGAKRRAETGIENWSMAAWVVAVCTSCTKVLIEVRNQAYFSTEMSVDF
eukprot:scaffold146_cov265-Pinguiococcus_pyrenoidosus.AAC.37